VDSDGSVVQTQSAMATGTSPAIVGLKAGGYAQAFVASSGMLWTEGPDGNGHSTGIVAAPGTSPAITADPLVAADAWQVAFQDQTHQLVVIDQSNQVFHPSTATPAETSSPDIDALLSGS
jgi:hypothetical protein